MSSNNFTQGHSVKIEWLISDVTVVGYPEIAERANLGGIVAGRVFSPIQVIFVIGGHFVV